MVEPTEPTGQEPEGPDRHQDPNGWKLAAFEHASSWFEYHAKQRMQSVNFFLITIAFLGNAYVSAVTEDEHLVAGGVAAIGMLIGVVFHKLDKRSSDLVKAGERAMRPGEDLLAATTSNPKMKILDEVDTPPTGTWSYSAVFRCLFVSTSVFFFAGLLYALAQEGLADTGDCAESDLASQILAGIALLPAGVYITGIPFRRKSPKGFSPIPGIITWLTGIIRNVSTLLRQQRVGISVVGLASRAVLFRRGGQPPHPRDFSRHALGCPRVVVDRGLDLVC